MFFSAFIGFQGWNSWTPETSMLSGMSRSSTAAALLGWFLASFLGGLISILVSRLELSSASRLRAAALSDAVLSEVALLEESCASEMAVSSPKKTTVNRVRTTLLYRDANGEARRPRSPTAAPKKIRPPTRWDGLIQQVLRGGGKFVLMKTAE